MTCCDSWGHCTRGPGCAAGSLPATARGVASVGISRRRSDDEQAEEISNSAWAMLNANESPGQRGNVWFAEDEPTACAQPMRTWERVAFVAMVGITSAASLAIAYGVFLYFTGQASS